MSRNTVQSATIDPLARPARQVGHGLSAPAQVLLDLARPWHVILSQLLLMAEPLCTPSQRVSLQSQMRRLECSLEPFTGKAGLATEMPLLHAGPDHAAGGEAL